MVLFELILTGTENEYVVPDAINPNDAELTSAFSTAEDAVAGEPGVML